MTAPTLVDLDARLTIRALLRRLEDYGLRRGEAIAVMRVVVEGLAE